METPNPPNDTKGGFDSLWHPKNDSSKKSKTKTSISSAISAVSFTQKNTPNVSPTFSWLNLNLCSGLSPRLNRANSRANSGGIGSSSCRAAARLTSSACWVFWSREIAMGTNPWNLHFVGGFLNCFHICDILLWCNNLHFFLMGWQRSKGLVYRKIDASKINGDWGEKLMIIQLWIVIGMCIHII